MNLTKKMLITLTLILPLSSWAKVDLIYDRKGVAIEGYDVVSYIQDNRAQKGDGKIQSTFKGTKYYFSSQNNKNKFVKSPEKYLPAYGGWCAWAMAEYGDFAEIDPESFLVVTTTSGQKQTLLFYKSWRNNTRKKWTQKIKGNTAKTTLKKQLGLIKTANKNWAAHLIKAE